MNIEILGTGCPQCKKLAKITEQAANELGIDCNIKKITDIRDILKYKVMTTPTLVINNELKASGRVPSIDEIKKILGG